MSQTENGNTVRFHYVGSLPDGTVFDSSEGREPLQVTVGSGEVIRGVDQALAGMEPGQEKTVSIPADEAYGPHRPELIQQVAREQVPPEVDLEVGNRLQAADAGGRRVVVTVVDVDDEQVTLDANHPLAGQDLTFELKLVQIV